MPRGARLPVLRAAPLVLWTVTLGCAEEPSMQLSWRISDDPALLGEYAAAPELVSAVQCSAVGISKVQLTVRAMGSLGAGEHYEFPCFPGDAVDGPVLEPGEYELELRGLRRAGTAWTESLLDPETEQWLPSCAEGQDPCPAFAEGSVEIREGAQPLVELVLLAPPQCDDGIDNDLDGKVDQNDLACRIELDGLAAEGDDVGLTIFELRVGFLNSALIGPDNVQVEQLELTLDGEPWSPWSAGPILSLDETSYPFSLPLVGERLDAGEHELGVVALDGQGQPLTQSLVETFSVDPNEGGYVTRELIFGAEHFISPITDRFSLIWSPISEAGALLPVCSAAIGDVRVRVREGQDPLGIDELGLPGSQDAGWITTPCTAFFDSAPLAWDDDLYQLDFEALSTMGTTCFALSDYTLIPRGTASSQLMLVPPAADVLPEDCL